MEVFDLLITIRLYTTSVYKMDELRHGIFFFIRPLKGFRNYSIGNYDFKLCYKYWYRLLVVMYVRHLCFLKDNEDCQLINWTKLKSEKNSIIIYLSILISILITIYFEVVLNTSRAKHEVLIF